MGWLTWDRFEEGLADELPFMQDHDTVVLDYGDYYVQLSQTVDALRAEAIGNAYLPADRRLDADAERRLTELGWELPKPPPLAAENWWCDTGWPMNSAAGRLVANRLCRTLQEVYGVPEPGALTHQAWHYLSNEPLRWPVFVGLTGRPPPGPPGSGPGRSAPGREPAVAGWTGDPRDWRPSDPDSQWWNPKPGDPYGPSDQPPHQPWEPEPPVRRFP